MKGKFHLKLGLLCAILSAMLVSPALGQGKGSPEEQFKQHRIQMIKDLKLAPDKEKAVLAVADKYDGQRKEIIDNLRKTKADLETALAAPKPDEAKVKELVNSLTSGMDALFNSFKSQREEELAQMSPIEQGKYLLMLNKMREEMMKKPKMPKK
ncbi:MAG: periplasmic heavy metal sensor [Deltaproteobacteria bacterium]|nr:periplasmic heavy metal sensor [Deltaproteobacteria bacterium]